MGRFGIREGSLTALAAKGSFWTTAGFGMQYGLRLVSSLVLTRLLSPDAFGLLALAMVFLSGLQLLSDVGTTPSIIRSQRGEEPEFLYTAWTLQAARGVIIASIACLLAWPYAQIYDEPLLFPMVLALSLTVVLQGLSSIAIPLARRHMDLHKLTILEVLVQAVTTAATILFAWGLQSVWALVVGAVFGAGFRLFLSYRILPPASHAFRLERAAVSEILRFGRWILVGTLLTFLSGRGRVALQGLLVPVDTLGLLRIAGIIGWTPGELTAKILGNVAFPAISRQVREKPESVRATLRKIQLALAGAFLPVFLLLSWFADDLIGLLYDDRYALAGSYLSLMALNGALGVLSMPYQNAMLAEGNSRFHAGVMAVAAAFKIVGIFLGFHLGGVYGMLTGVAISSVIVHIVSATLAWRRGFANLPLDALSLGGLVLFYAYTLSTILQT